MSDKPRGYVASYGYCGFIDGEWQLYSTEEEYIEAWKEFYGVTV